MNSYILYSYVLKCRKHEPERKSEKELKSEKIPFSIFDLSNIQKGIFSDLSLIYKTILYSA